MPIAVIAIDIPPDIESNLQRYRYHYGPISQGLENVRQALALANGLWLPALLTFNGKDHGYWSGLHDYIPWNCPFTGRRNTFSNFFGNAFSKVWTGGQSRLESRLREDNIDEMLLIGYDRDRCLKSTAEGALAAGFHVTTSERLMFSHNLQYEEGYIRSLLENRIISGHEYERVMAKIESEKGVLSRDSSMDFFTRSTNHFYDLDMLMSYLRMKALGPIEYTQTQDRMFQTAGY